MKTKRKNFAKGLAIGWSIGFVLGFVILTALGLTLSLIWWAVEISGLIIAVTIAMIIYLRNIIKDKKESGL